MKKNKIKSFFKDLSFHLFGGLFVGIVIGIVIGYIVGFVTKIISDLAFATGIMAIGTLTLAFLTYWNIHSNNAQEKRDRKDRLLNEIIEWAEDIGKCGINPDIELYDNLQVANGDTKKEQAAEWKHRKQLLSLVLTISKRIKYMNKIAPKIDKGLDDTMMEVVHNLHQQIKLLTEALTGLRQVSTTEIGLQIQKLGDSADKLIEEATEIQAKDIS